MKRDKQVWFKDRHNGYGWVPVSWQGWAIVMVWVALFAGFVAWMNLRFTNVWLAMAISILFGGFWLGILHGIALSKGGRPLPSRDGHVDAKERQP